MTTSPPKFSERVVQLVRANERFALESAEAERHRRLTELCDAREIPVDVDVRRVATADATAPTIALDAIRRAFAWRDVQLVSLGCRQSMTVILGGTPAGAGRSSALARAVVHHPTLALFTSARDVGWTSRTSRNRGAIAQWLHVDLLGVDDLDVLEKPEERQRVTELLVERAAAGRATLAATHLRLEAFEAAYVDARLASRLRGQVRGGRPDALPWWFELPSIDLRNEEGATP
ncbi:MAG: hypothetical protein WCJ30_02705 [Deltaproteobacteria bacterium]